AEHGAAGAGVARAVAADRLHDGAEAAPDHGDKGAGRSRRVAAGARIPGAVRRGRDAETTGLGPDGAGLRRLGATAGDAGAELEAVGPRGARCDPSPDR